jgi:hypothetical protein
LALMPTARSWRERAIVVSLVIAVPLISIAPFLITSSHDTIHAMRQNSGVPGFGALSAFVQPDLTRHWATLHGRVTASSATLHLVDVQRTVVAIGALLATVLAWRRRLPALQAASFIWLVVLVVNPNFAYQYLIWGLPFFIAAGYLREIALFQAAILPATLWLYWRPGAAVDGWTYLVAIQAVWIAMACIAVLVAVRLLHGRGLEKTPVTAPRRATA